MIWGIATLIAAVLAIGFAIVRRRRLSAGEVMQLIGQVPSSPIDGTQWLYGGRFSAPDPDPRKTAVGYVDRRPERSLPPGVQRSDAAE